jgi:hypothetical protein
LPSALEDGAQRGVTLRPRFVIIELGLLPVWTTCVRRRRAREIPEETVHRGLVFDRSIEPRSAHQEFQHE